MAPHVAASKRMLQAFDEAAAGAGAGVVAVFATATVVVATAGLGAAVVFCADATAMMARSRTVERPENR